MENYRIQFNNLNEYECVLDVIKDKQLTGSVPIRFINQDANIDHGYFFFYWNPMKSDELLLLVRNNNSHNDNLNDMIGRFPHKAFLYISCSEFLGMNRVKVIENIIKQDG